MREYHVEDQWKQILVESWDSVLILDPNKIHKVKVNPEKETYNTVSWDWSAKPNISIALAIIWTCSGPRSGDEV